MADEQLSDEALERVAAGARAGRRRRARRISGAIYAGVAVNAVVILMMISGLVWLARLQGQSEQRDIKRSREICLIIVQIDDRYQKLAANPASLPAATRADTLDFARALHTTRERIGCDQK